jgi:lysophospholipase L1-like esterase
MNGAEKGTDLPDLYNRWTDLLAARFAALPDGQSMAVANEGIAGNLVASEFRPALLRMADDVLGREGATHVIFLEGTNDIAAGTTADRLIAADQRIIGDAHQIGLNIIGATIIPRGGDPLWTSSMEMERLKLNDWIRNGQSFDGVIDFDALLQGPPGTITHLVGIPPKWSCYDGVHPNAAGYAAMAASIDLSLFHPKQ